MRRDDLIAGPVRLTAYDWVPALAQGYVRDLRVRWALEEARFSYEAALMPLAERAEPENLARQPFGQVPALQVGERSMFESGAIVWRIAEASQALLPAGEAERDACLSWYFAALDSLSTPIDLVNYLRFFAEDREAANRVERQAAEFLHLRLSRFANALGDRPFLVADRFTVADLMMVFVLRGIDRESDLDRYPALPAYIVRHTDRPAFQAALDAQMRPFRENAARYETTSREPLAQREETGS